MTETWTKAYTGIIHLSGDLTNCTFSGNVVEFNYPPSITTKVAEGLFQRGLDQLVSSVFLVLNQNHKVCRYDIGGHKESTCMTAI